MNLGHQGELVTGDFTMHRPPERAACPASRGARPTWTASPPSPPAKAMPTTGAAPPRAHRADTAQVVVTHDFETVGPAMTGAARLRYDLELIQNPSGRLPRISTMGEQLLNYQQTPFAEAYPENRVRAFVHHWLSLLEQPAAGAEPVRELLDTHLAMTLSDGRVLHTFDVAAAFAVKQGGKLAGSWRGLGNAGPGDQDQAARCGDGVGMAGGAVAHDGRDDQGHRQDVGTQAVVVETGVEGDVLAGGDDHGGALIWPRAGLGGTVARGDTKTCRGDVQAGERIRQPECGHRDRFPAAGSSARHARRRVPAPEHRWVAAPLPQAMNAGRPSCRRNLAASLVSNSRVGRAAGWVRDCGIRLREDRLSGGSCRDLGVFCLEFGVPACERVPRQRG
jgi:hypothetical protein